jgi:hypothetical protein
VTTCNAGYGNCDGSHANGCEVNINTSVSHCGGCGAACSQANGTASCSGGNCAIACNSPYANCNGNARTDGCEINTSNNASHCGACNNTCNTGQVCSNSTCTSAGCPTGYRDCNANGVCSCEGDGCCGTGCQIKHNTGLGQNWFDCVAYGTYTSSQAGKACQAWSVATGSTGACELINCQQGQAMCNKKDAACWGFSNLIAGRVYKGKGNQICPISTDAMWDP